MKLLIVLSCMAVAAYARPDSTYTDKYDQVNLDEILSNPRLRIPYIKCLLDQGKCSPEGKELKAHISEAMSNKCGKCTAKQREGSRVVIGYIINHEPEYWQQLTAKYDPERKYVKEYENELKKISHA
uniref:Putative chemosensory protein 4 n=1 Tax=Conopomorpha sinensis TaxID=940481 RepID=A0A5Q2UQS4_9NEOP|nr:putative chemosensory protein 4 [Conopomorpha sinensis]